MNDLTEDSPQLTNFQLTKIVKHLLIPLKKHQNTCINALIQLESNGTIEITKECKLIKSDIMVKEDYNYRNDSTIYNKLDFIIETNFGILADKVGAGKTFEIIGLICHNLIPPNNNKTLGSSFLTSLKYIDSTPGIKTNLIIVPHSLIMQWKTAFEYTNLDVYTIFKHVHIENLEEINLSPNVAKEVCIAHYDVLLVSVTMLDHLYIKHPNIKWARAIIDEISSIKLPLITELRANFMWFISATPNGIRYIRKSFIRDIMNSMQNIVFQNIIIKNNEKFVDQSMCLPTYNQIVIKCFTPVAVKIFTQFVSHDVLNMLNAGDINGAIKSLNCNVDTDDNIIQVLTNNLTKSLHNKKIELQYHENLIPINQDTIKRIKEQIISLENRHTNITQKIKEFKEDCCPICLDDFTVPTIISCCNNIFCFECITRSKNSKCPMCRCIFTPANLIVIDNEKQLAKAKAVVAQKLLSKKQNLINIIKNKPHGKFLVFSSYENTNDNISTYFIENKINYSKISGHISQINKTIDDFNNGNVKVLLLNAAYFGSGLNLQMATDIIIYHEMDRELETQVIGRAQRYGRKSNLNVYYLFNDKEKINCSSKTLELNIFEDDDANVIKNLFHDTDNNIINEDAISLTAKPKQKKKVVI